MVFHVIIVYNNPALYCFSKNPLTFLLMYFIVDMFTTVDLHFVTPELVMDIYSLTLYTV